MFRVERTTVLVLWLQFLRKETEFTVEMGMLETMKGLGRNQGSIKEKPRALWQLFQPSEKKCPKDTLHVGNKTTTS